MGADTIFSTATDQAANKASANCIFEYLPVLPARNIRNGTNENQAIIAIPCVSWLEANRITPRANKPKEY